VCAIDAACEVIERQATKAVMTGKPLDASRYDAIAQDLRGILERHAAAYRSVRST